MGGELSRITAKMSSIEDAVSTIERGDVVHVAPYSTTPYSLCAGLKHRVQSGDLSGIRVDHPAAFFSWTDEGMVGAVELHDNYATPPNRAALSLIHI